MKRHEHAVQSFDIRTIEVPALAVSSTDIRERVGRGSDVRYLVTDGVAEYIRDRGLYRTEELADG